MSIIIDNIRRDDSPKAIALKTGMALESICADYEYDVFISTYPRRQVTLTAYEDTDIDDIDALDEYALLDDAAQLLTAIKEYLSEMEDALLCDAVGKAIEAEEDEDDWDPLHIPHAQTLDEYLEELKDKKSDEKAEGREFNSRTSNIDLSDYDMEDVKMRDDDWTIGLTD